jgi:ABC-type branched-subunit amino acid transport system ATPase component
MRAPGGASRDGAHRQAQRTKVALRNVTFALPLANRIYILGEGRIAWEGAPAHFAAEAAAHYL